MESGRFADIMQEHGVFNARTHRRAMFLRRFDAAFLDFEEAAT